MGMDDPEDYEQATEGRRSDQEAIYLGAFQEVAPEADGKYG
jgi:hypothetical protein